MDIKDERNFKVKRQCPRNLYLEQDEWNCTVEDKFDETGGKMYKKMVEKSSILKKWAEVYGGGVFESARVRRDRSNILNYIFSKDWLFPSWECLLFVDLGVSLLIFKKTVIEDITAVLGGLTAEGSNTPRNHIDLIVLLNQ